MIKKKPPNREWLLNMLHTFTPDHAFFTKGFVKKQYMRQAEQGSDDDAGLANDDGFFDGLPLYSGSASTPTIRFGVQSSE